MQPSLEFQVLESQEQPISSSIHKTFVFHNDTKAMSIISNSDGQHSPKLIEILTIPKGTRVEIVSLKDEGSEAASSSLIKVRYLATSLFLRDVWIERSEIFKF